MNSQKIIIGAGISGLIYSYYNPDFIVISENVGGKLKNNYLTPTILLHDTPETNRLLLDLNLIFPKKKHQIMYYYNSSLQTSISDALKKVMVRKKLTNWYQLQKSIIERDKALVSDTTLSVNETSIPIFETSTSFLVEKLASKTTIINEKVLQINKNEVVTTKSVYPYSELVSTIPAPLFWKLYGKRRKFKSLPVTFVLTDKSPVEHNTSWDLIYFVDNDIPFTRVNRYNDRFFLYEFTGGLSQTEVEQLLPGTRIHHLFTDPYGIILTKKNEPPPNVQFIGRFATWNHSDKIQEAIKVSARRHDSRSFNSKINNDFNKDLADLIQKFSHKFNLVNTNFLNSDLFEIWINLLLSELQINNGWKLTVGEIVITSESKKL